MKMPKITKKRLVVVVALPVLMVSSYALAAANASAPINKSATAERTVSFKTVDGKDVGTATLIDNPHGTLVRLSLKNLSPGTRAFHIHEKADCDASKGFTSAGAHLNIEGKKHGYHSDEGPHPGDMPNLVIPDNGALDIEIFNHHVSFNDKKIEDQAVLLDDDGSALIIHAGADDYITQPTGGAGDRYACAEIK